MFTSYRMSLFITFSVHSSSVLSSDCEMAHDSQPYAATRKMQALKCQYVTKTKKKVYAEYESEKVHHIKMKTLIDFTNKTNYTKKLYLF